MAQTRNLVSLPASSEIFHLGSLFWKAKLSGLCQVIHKLIWLIKWVAISERDTCSLCQLFSVIVVAALFLCSLFHPTLLRVTVKSERIDATDSLLDWYLFIYLLIFFVLYPFFFCFLPSSCFCMSVFMFPAAVAAVLCCNTEAEVSLAVKTLSIPQQHCKHKAACFAVLVSNHLCLPLFLSVCLNISQCCCSVCHHSLHRIHEPHPCSLAGD